MDDSSDEGTAWSDDMTFINEDEADLTEVTCDNRAVADSDEDADTAIGMDSRKILEIPKIEIIKPVPEEDETNEESADTHSPEPCNANPQDSKPRFQVVRVPSYRKGSRARRLSAQSDESRKHSIESDRKVSIQIEDGADHLSNKFLNPGACNTHRLSIDSYFHTQTFGRDTHEALPHAEHYQDLLSAINDIKQRPTLEELHENQKSNSRGKSEGCDKKTEQKSKALKFGWIQGVLMRCLLNIFGVMIFLRLTWITGQAGIGFSSIVILMSSVVTSITTMSMSAICTNGEVKGGGAYYMISRSLGPQFGGAIGMLFSLANAVAAAMYVVGFAETMRNLMWEYDVQITGDSIHEVRIIGICTTVLLIGIVIIGTEWESKAQIFLLVVLVTSIVNFFVGTILPPTEEKKMKGFLGYKGDIFLENFGPKYTDGNSFFSVFSIFFPSATGILAGANISGDLKDPQEAIPKGTFLAIIVTTVVYLGIAWCSGSCMLRTVFVPAALTSNLTNFPITDPHSDICAERVCKVYGLQNDVAAAELASASGYLILAGIFSATLSSALACLVSAPKVFQAVAKDELYPGIIYFAKGSGLSNEPKRGVVLAFFICLAMVCIGALDTIAPIISNFFLIAYALINFSCFDASISKQPGFRPAFKYYNKWISLVGFGLSVAIMFLINWWAALITFAGVGALYFYVHLKKPDVNWGSSGQAHAYKDALTSSLQLVDVLEHVKNFRPQVLALTGYPKNRPALVEFVAAITKKQSLLVCGHVFRGDIAQHKKHLHHMTAYTWFRNEKLKAFYNCVASSTLRTGTQALLQASGIGKLRPNTLIMGFKSDWQTDSHNAVNDYLNIIHDAFDLNYGVGILRLPEGLNKHNVSDENLEVHVCEENIQSSDDENDLKEQDNYAIEEERTSVQVNNGEVVLQRFARKKSGIDNPVFTEEVWTPKDNLKTSISAKTAEITDKENLTNRFNTKQTGTIDVWWLFDDGGLTLLVPYMLSLRKQWKGCNLRVFCAGSNRYNMDEEHTHMVTLLNKFRIDYSQISIIPDIRSKPKSESYKEFENTIQAWQLRENENQADYPWKVSEADLLGNKQKTYRNIKLRELLQEHSKDAALIVLTLPMPRKDTCPAGLYMTWLELITRDMPPFFLLRGNQQNVLTYYS